MNCPNCGAPRTGPKCEYCGTEFEDYSPVAEKIAEAIARDVRIAELERDRLRLEEQARLLRQAQDLNNCFAPKPYMNTWTIDMAQATQSSINQMQYENSAQCINGYVRMGQLLELRDEFERAKAVLRETGSGRSERSAWRRLKDYCANHVAGITLAISTLVGIASVPGMFFCEKHGCIALEWGCIISGTAALAIDLFMLIAYAVENC